MKILYENNFYKLLEKEGKLYRFDRILLSAEEVPDQDKQPFAMNLWYATQGAYKNGEVTWKHVEEVKTMLSEVFNLFTPKSEKS